MNRYGTAQERRHPKPVTEGIWMWSVEYEKDVFFNSYLLQTGRNESVLVDPLLNDFQGKPLMDWSEWDSFPKPQAVWLTGSDHERDSQLFCRHFDIPLQIAEAEAGLLSIRATRYFTHKEVLRGGWQVLQLSAQKTPAECVFYQPERQWLLVGDALLSQEDGRLRRPYDEPSYADEEKARQGLLILANLPVQGVFPGHGDPVLQQVKTRLYDALEQDPRTIAGVV